MHEYFSYSFLTLVCTQLIDMWLLFFIISTTINICIHIIVDWLRKVIVNVITVIIIITIIIMINWLRNPSSSSILSPLEGGAGEEEGE